MTLTRRALASRDTRWAHALAHALAQAGVRPNAVSLAGVVFAIGGGLAFAAAPTLAPGARAAAFVAAAAAIQLRLLCNLLDGMIAVEEGLKSKTGDLYNEFPDRVADVALLVGAGYSQNAYASGPFLGWTCAVLAVITAYVRLLGGSLRVTQHFTGPMAKQHRMFTLTIAGLAGAVEAIAGWPARAIFVALALIAGGAVVTVIRRLRLIAGELAER
jgi:phosphatidylglycerophosphate synthase